MKPSEALELHRPEVRRIIASRRACNPRVFGSVARGTDTEHSDLDLLVDPLPDFSLFDVSAIMQELETLLGFSVDVVTPSGLPDRIFFKVIVEARPV